MQILSMYDRNGYFYFFEITHYYRRIYKDFDMDFHCHEDVEIMYVNFGEINIIYAESKGAPRRTATVSTGEFVVIDGGIPHKIMVGNMEAQIINMEFCYSAPRQPLCLSVKTLIENDPEFRLFISLRERFFIITDLYNIGRQFSLLIEYLQSVGTQKAETLRSPYVDYSIAAILSQIASNYVQQNQLHTFTGIKYLRKATKYISENYSHLLTAEKVAENAGVSQNYLNKLFSDEFSMTINEYINHYKITKAKLLLEKTNVPIAQIAAQVGYKNKQSFNKNFFRHVGMTPRAYKKINERRMDVHWT